MSDCAQKCQLSEQEEFLSKHAYLSGKNVPSEKDVCLLEKMTECPDRKKFPNLFSWWWSLSQFAGVARELWGEKAEEEEPDLFGEETEEDKAAAEKRKMLAEYNKNNQKKMLLQESRVVLEVKGFEVGQDFEALAGKIYA